MGKEKKEKGKKIKIGLSRIRIDGKWRRWEEIEKELRSRESGKMEGESMGNRKESRINNGKNREKKNCRPRRSKGE